MHKVKIMVIKKSLFPELAEVYGHPDRSPLPPCQRFEVGQVFYSTGPGDIPEAFCGWAYADIQRDIAAVMMGGSMPWMKEEGVQIACCTDGLRPVVFKIERAD